MVRRAPERGSKSRDAFSNHDQVVLEPRSPRTRYMLVRAEVETPYLFRSLLYKKLFFIVVIAERGSNIPDGGLNNHHVTLNHGGAYVSNHAQVLFEPRSLGIRICRGVLEDKDKSCRTLYQHTNFDVISSA